MTRVAVLISRIRVEEKLLLVALEAAGATRLDADVALERSVSTARGLYALRMLAHAGLPTVNNYHTAAACADKLLTTAALPRRLQPGVGAGCHRGVGLPCSAQAGGRIVGPAAGPHQRPRRGRGGAGAQGGAGVVSAQRLYEWPGS